jgi:hypothetical protein
MGGQGEPARTLNGPQKTPLEFIRRVVREPLDSAKRQVFADPKKHERDYDENNSNEHDRYNQKSESISKDWTNCPRGSQ